MTDITPGVRPHRWATLIGTWIGRVRVFAAQVSVIFQLAPILTTGVIGLLAGLSIAQWSQQQIAAFSPLAVGIPGAKTATTSAMSWLVDDSAVIFFDGSARPVAFYPSGEAKSAPPLLPSSASDVAISASIVLPAEDGVLAVRTTSFEVVTPGGLAAIDGKGSLYVTGAARIRNKDKSNERGIEATAPNSQAVWRTELAIAPSAAGEPTRFALAIPWDTAVTAMIALPAPGRIAVGGADGRIAFIGEDGRPIMSADRTFAKNGLESHGAPVVALAAAGTWTDQGRAQLASAASDGSIKVWYPLDGGAILTSRDVRFPEGPSVPLAPDSLELSDDAQFLTVRTPAGAIFVARLAAVPSDTSIVAELPLGYAATASALSRRSGASLYVAAPDCSVQEVDLSNLSADPTHFIAGIVSVTKKLTLRGHGGPISRLAVSHNGQYLAAASLDGRVRIHHLSPLRNMTALPFADVPTGPGCFSTEEVRLPALSGAVQAAVIRLAVSRFADAVYFLTAPITWKANSGAPSKSYPIVEVPVGFVLTFESVPRAFWSLINPDGDLTIPAIIHDYLYWTQNVPRDVADGILKQAMEDVGIDPKIIAAVYAAARSSGANVWNENARLKAQGEKRFLKEYPADPAVRWSEWKTRPGVFSD